MKKPTVELKLPILPNMELIATQTAEDIARHMNLTDDQSGEISMALIFLANPWPQLIQNFYAHFLLLSKIFLLEIYQTV